MNTRIIATIIAAAPLLASQVAVADSLDDDAFGESRIEDDAELEEEEGEKFNMNITANPFYLALGGLQGGVSFRLDRGNAAGVVGSTFNIAGSGVSTFGVQGQRHLQGGDVMSDGLVLDASLEMLFYTFEGYNVNTFEPMTESYTAAQATGSVNWQWAYDNGFNFRLGIGLAATVGIDEDMGYAGGRGSSLTTVSDSIAINGVIDGKLAWAF